MANELIDITFIAAKIAALNNEKARVTVGALSLVYNGSQFLYYQKMVAEYSQYLSVLTYKATVHGYAAQEDLVLANQCKEGIQFCQIQMAKHGGIAALDVASLLIDTISMLTKKQ